MTSEVLTLTRDIADRLQDLKSADDWRSAELAEQIALQAERLDRLARAAAERPSVQRRAASPALAASPAVS